MTLKDYLIKYNLSPHSFAKITGLTSVTIYRLLKGYPCTLKTAKRIYKVTKRNVRLREDIS